MLSVPACTDNDAPLAVSSSATAGSDASAAAPATSTTTTTLGQAELEQRLDETVATFAKTQTVQFSVVVLDVTTGAHVRHLADRVVRSASLYKLFVARELMRRFYAGTLKRAAPANDGRGRTIGDCVRDMIVLSDNLCGAAGLRIVGRGALDRDLHRDGFVSTSLASPQRTSADDIALFFERAREGTLLGPTGTPASDELYSLLREQQVNDRLPTKLPSGAVVAHKTGDIRQWAHDAGVITTDRGEAVLVVLSGPWPAPCCDAEHPGPAEAKAFGAIADLGREVYDALA